MNQVTVAELIAILQTLPQDAPVELQASCCCCYGPCSGAIISGDEVLLTRGDDYEN